MPLKSSRTTLVNLKKRLALAAQVLRNGQLDEPRRREIPSITAEQIAEVREFFPLPKFFIFGHARSGTTLLTRLVRLHREVHCNYQAHFFTRLPLLQSLVADPEVGEWLARRSNRWNRGQDLSPLVMRVTADFILEREARQLGKRIVGDKSPNSLLEEAAVSLMHQVYPDASLIFIVRDGRDMAVSHRFQNFIDAAQHLPAEDLRLREAFTQDPQPFLSGQRSIFTRAALLREASGWARNVTRTDQEARRLYGEKYLHLRYEDLLERPLAELQRLWNFLGADAEAPGMEQAVAAELASNPDADWQKHKAAGLIEPLEKGKRGSWRSLFNVEDRRVFKQQAGEALIAWDYEPGLDW
ncbi:MAG TPA: sulfotransferase [Anaerolineales bacterium]|nr:sulfotransferase [Anaerolineales bacterium]